MSVTDTTTKIYNSKFIIKYKIVEIVVSVVRVLRTVELLSVDLSHICATVRKTLLPLLGKRAAIITNIWGMPGK